MENQYWLLWLDSRNSVIRGWFDDLNKAIHYYNNITRENERSLMAIFDQDHKQVYPEVK